MRWTEVEQGRWVLWLSKVCSPFPLCVLILREWTDADECYTAIISALRTLPHYTPETETASTSSAVPGLSTSQSANKFVEQYMMGELTQRYDAHNTIGHGEYALNMMQINMYRSTR